MKRFKIALFSLLLACSANIFAAGASVPAYVGSFNAVEGQTIVRDMVGAYAKPFSDTANFTVTVANTYNFEVLAADRANTACRGCSFRITLGGSSLVDFSGVVLAYSPVRVWLAPGTYSIEQTGMLSGKTNRPYTGAGSYSFKYFGDVLPVAGGVCSGTSTILAISSKVFMTLADGSKLAYSNVYGSRGTTVFTPANPVFTIGVNISYSGIYDSTLICIPDAITIF
jgi:hypothetical protein